MYRCKRDDTCRVPGKGGTPEARKTGSRNPHGGVAQRHALTVTVRARVKVRI